MISKILLTAFVILVAMAVVRAKARPQASKKAQASAEIIPSKWARGIAYAFLGLTLVFSGLFFYWQWQEGHRIFTIRVIPGGSGKIVQYKAYKQDLKGRKFQTLDGRQVTLGDGERMELLEDD